MAKRPIGGRTKVVTYNDTTYRSVSLPTLHMIQRINDACRTHGIAVSRFGRQAVGDPRLLSDLMNGRALRPGTSAKVLRFIDGLGEA